MQDIVPTCFYAVPSPTAVDQILHATQVAAQDNVCSPQMKAAMKFLNYNVHATNKFFLRLNSMKITILFLEILK